MTNEQLVWDGHSCPSLLTLTLLVWDGHSCPSPLMLILLVWDGHSSPSLLTLKLPVWDGHSCPSPLTLLVRDGHPCPHPLTKHLLRQTGDSRSGITNDPNRVGDPQYVLRLIGQVVTVSLGTVTIVGSPPLGPPE